MQYFFYVTDTKMQQQLELLKELDEDPGKKGSINVHVPKEVIPREESQVLDMKQQQPRSGSKLLYQCVLNVSNRWSFYRNIQFKP